MKIFHPWIAPAALLGSAVAGHGVTYLNVEQAQRALFPGASFAAVPLALSPEQRKAIERASGVPARRVPKVWRVNGGGWFFVDEVLGKHEFITYAVGIGADGSVRGIEIMDYRETYGDEVRGEKWRRQFVGKTKAAPLKLDEDIKNISGATLSSRHITDGVKRLLATLDIALRG